MWLLTLLAPGGGGGGHMAPPGKDPTGTKNWDFEFYLVVDVS